MATGAYSTLLAIPGRKIGHVQLIHLPECMPPEPLGPPTGAPPQPPPAPTKHPVSMIVAHETALSTLSVPPSGKLIATTSARGTLVRVWDTVTGNRLRELRRGSDQAEIYGVAFRPDEQELCVWSDKGTVHVFSLVSGSGSSYVPFRFYLWRPFEPLFLLETDTPSSHPSHRFCRLRSRYSVRSGRMRRTASHHSSPTSHYHPPRFDHNPRASQRKISVLWVGYRLLWTRTTQRIWNTNS
jgi:hypothetical protein